MRLGLGLGLGSGSGLGWGEGKGGVRVRVRLTLPPTKGRSSKSSTSCPASTRSMAAIMPARPAPTTAILSFDLLTTPGPLIARPIRSSFRKALLPTCRGKVGQGCALGLGLGRRLGLWLKRRLRARPKQGLRDSRLRWAPTCVFAPSDVKVSSVATIESAGRRAAVTALRVDGTAWTARPTGVETKAASMLGTERATFLRQTSRVSSL